MVGIKLFIFVSVARFVLADQPNIIFIMADDLGWNDVSWRDSNIHSPNLHYLAHNNGALLEQAYVNKLCSITRSAFMTGLYPHHIGTNHGLFHCMEPSGVPLDLKFFPELLQDAGYMTYLVGKWHLGYCKKEYLPTSRGFHYFKGYYNGREDYYNHSQVFKEIYTGMDFWDEERAVYEANGKYSTEIYTNYVKEILSSHNKKKPFFIYLAYQAVHEPLQVPEKYLKYCNQTNFNRRMYCGMVSAMDQSVGHIVESLKEHNLYEDTVLLFSTDNGGNTLYGGNNFPLRGNKDTIWEGGTKATSFAHSAKFIKQTGTRNQLFTVVDWFPTILSLAGLDYTSYGDGINQWSMISENHVGNRTSFIYNIEADSSAIRRDKYKLTIGDPGRPSGWIPPVGRIIDDDKFDGLQLFDLDEDPVEKHNLASQPQHIMLVSSMLKELAGYLEEMKPSVHKPTDPAGDPALFNGTFSSGFC